MQRRLPSPSQRRAASSCPRVSFPVPSLIKPRYVRASFDLQTATIVNREADEQTQSTTELDVQQVSPTEDVSHPSLPYTPAFKQNDIVYGTVLNATGKGASASIMYHEGLVGYMPVDQNPLSPEEWAKTSPGAFDHPVMPKSSSGHNRLDPRHAHQIPLGRHMRLDKGHTRPFKVLSIPPDMQVKGKGPLLSAYAYDRDMLWARASQLHQLALEDKELVFSVKVTGYNRGGLIADLMGLEAFIPNSHVCRRPGLNLYEAIESMMGKEVEVAMLEFEPYAHIKISETAASELKTRLTCEKIVPGDVVCGVVSKFTNSGAFLKIHGLPFDAILFNNHISSDPPESAWDVFTEGEQVYAVVIESHDDKLRLSTRLLEREYGEMRTSKGLVFSRTAAGPRTVQLSDPGEEAPRGQAGRGRGDGEEQQGSSWPREQQAGEGRRYGLREQHPQESQRYEEEGSRRGQEQQRGRGGVSRREYPQAGRNRSGQDDDRSSGRSTRGERW